MKKQIKVTITCKKGTRVNSDSIQNEILEAINSIERVTGASISVKCIPVSRSERMAEAESIINEGIGEITCVREELGDWLDNMPEGLSDGDKAMELEEAVSQLEDVEDAIESTVSDLGEIAMPGMY